MNLKKILMSLTLCAAATAASSQSAEHKTTFDPQREAFDRIAYAEELRQQNTAMQQGASAPRMDAADGREYPLNADGIYKYAGYNASAGGVSEAGAPIPGIVRFNLAPNFEVDSVATIPTLSPYSCWAGDAYYSFQPNRTNAGAYNSMDIVKYDPLTWEQVSTKRVRLSNGQNGIPYLPAYDPKTGLIFAINLANPVSGGNDYDLNIWDYQSNKLMRVSTLGTYDMYTARNDAYKGLFSDGNELYVHLANTNKGESMLKVNPYTGEKTLVGSFDVPHYSYSNQAFWYDNATETYYWDHFNLYEGTIFYKIDPNDVDDQGKIKQTEIIRPNTGYMNVFCLPSADARTPQPTDFKAVMNAEHTKATLSFTVPTTKTDGSNLTAAVISLTVNGQAVSVSGQPGEAVSVEVDAQQNINIATLRINDSYATGVAFVGGYDAPGKVQNAKVVMQNDGTMKISWNEPKGGRFADFGSLYDASDVTYTVVRTQDGHVVAEGLTALECIDNDVPEYIERYTYTITASSHSVKGEGVETNSVTAGSYLKLPYETHFDEASDLDIYTIWWDNPTENEQLSWKWNRNYNYVSAIGSTSGGFDDWLATPAFKASTDYVYSIDFDYSAGEGLTLDITAGEEATTESQSNVLLTITPTNGGMKHYTAYFTPETDGIYRFAFHAMADDRDMQPTIDNVRIAQAMSTLSPDRVTDVEYQNNEGNLNGNLFFTLPETNIKGEALTALTKYEVYVNEQLQTTVDNCQPGSAEEVEISGVKGFNTVAVIAYNNEGHSIKVEKDIFIGPDVPSNVPSINCSWGTSSALAHQINISWEAPETGKNGGYVNPAEYTYNLYTYDDNDRPELLETGLKDLSYTYTMRASGTTQKYCIFGIEVVNGEGKSVVARRGITQGGGYKLPFSENFVEGVHSNVWVNYRVSGNATWTFNYPVEGTSGAGLYNDNVCSANGDGFGMYLFNTSDNPAEQSLSTPIIDFKNAEKPVAKIWVYHDTNASDDSYFSLRACTDGSSYQEITGRVVYNDNAGWQLHVFPLDVLKGKRAMIGLNAHLSDFASKCFMDNIEICEAAGSDIALSGIAYDPMKVAGETTEVKVTVSNLGGDEAKDYEVMVYVDDEMLFDELPEEPLAVGAERIFTFQLPLTAIMAKEGALIYAEVAMDGDSNADNNCSNDIDIYPAVLNLPAPTAIAAEGATVSWMAPEAKAGMLVTEDFENYRSFTIDGFNGWTTVDVDEQLTINFIEYYDNYWPYSQQPQAYMIWDPKSNGNGNASAWNTPYGDKCLINWGTYGYTKDGRPAKEGTVQEDWLISPELVGGTEVSFEAKAQGCDMYGETVIVALSSSTDREMSSFTKFDELTIGDDHVSEWKHYSTQIPADAKYVALVAVQNGFGTMIDNLTYTRAITPVLLGYNVYQGLKRITDATAELEYVANKVGNYSVTAQYDLGESIATESVYISEIDGIADVECDQNLDSAAYNLQGVRVNAGYKGIIIKGGRKYVVK